MKLIAKLMTFQNYAAMAALILLALLTFYNTWTTQVIKQNQRGDIERAAINKARGELIQISLYAALEGRKLNAFEIDRIKTNWKQSEFNEGEEMK